MKSENGMLLVALAMASMASVTHWRIKNRARTVYYTPVWRGGIWEREGGGGWESEENIIILILYIQNCSDTCRAYSLTDFVS